MTYKQRDANLLKENRRGNMKKRVTFYDGSWDVLKYAKMTPSTTFLWG